MLSKGFKPLICRIIENAQTKSKNSTYHHYIITNKLQSQKHICQYDQCIHFSSLNIVIQQFKLLTSQTMNYHFKEGNRKENIVEQVQLLDQDLMKHKKDLEKLRLEAQFYEDKAKPISIDKQSLADEIMSELINDPYKPKYNFNKPQALPPPQHYNSPPKEYQPKPSYQPPAQAERQNNLMNEREMQKMKLQNQKHEGLFPNSSDHNRVRSFGKNVAQVLPEKDKGNPNFNGLPDQGSPKKAKSPEYQKKYDPAYNPFVKDDYLQKQRKQQKNRQYLKALEQQRQQQQRQKKARLKEQRQIKSQKYDSSKPAEKIEAVQKPLIMKKSDPNSQQPKVVATLGNYSQFDKNLIKEKVTQLRAKYKRGKIIYQEYERQLLNLRKQYPGDIDDLQQKENNTRKEYQPPRQIITQSYKQQQDHDFQSKEKIEEVKNEPASFPIRSQSINYSQFMPSMVQQQSYVPIPGYPPSAVAPPMMPGMYSMMPPPSYFQGAPPAEYMELLKKMFDFCFKEVKEVRTEQSAQNQVLQQTLNKFLLMSTQQPNLHTQQIPAIPNQLQREFYSDAKQHRQYFEKESNIKKKYVPSNQSLANIPFGQSDNSQYYDKSLSGIASKIPLNQGNQKMTTRDEEKSKVSALDQFYLKKYKVKPFKKFNIVVTPGQSHLEIPSTSSYFRAKNAKEDLKNKFEEDLNQLKKMQKDKSFKKAQEKVVSNTQYNTNDRRVLKEQPLKFVSSQSISQQISPISKQKQKEPVLNNPYLKRHISTEDNMLTFNNKELKLNSPTGFTPISKKQILQQDEYLTQPKIKEEIGGAASLINQYQQHLAQPVKALNFIKMNNQILSKYDKSQQSKRDYITIKDSGIKEISSRDYFVNNQISPVKPPQHYEESLQTIRSDFQSVKQSKNRANTGKFPLVPQNRPEEVQLDNQQIMQTVESVQESSSRFRKPPMVKRRSVGKKKETSISRSKNAYQSHLSFSGSQQVEQSVGHYQKFDSNVYESNYEQSVDLVKPSRPKPQMVLPLQKEQVKQGYIQLNPPTIITPKGISPKKETQVIVEVSKVSISKQLAPQNKWKSLEQARKQAKEGRSKGQQSKDQRSFEQKFSELQSFMTKKGDESQQISRMSFEMVHQDQRGRVRLTKSKEKQIQTNKKQGNKRNIMKLLQELQDDKEQDYKQQFESYREQSEQYQ